MTKEIQYKGQTLLVVDDCLPAIYYKLLDEQETKGFLAWADEQPPGTRVSGLWHPVVQDRLLRRAAKEAQ